MLSSKSPLTWRQILVRTTLIILVALLVFFGSGYLGHLMQPFSRSNSDHTVQLDWYPSNSPLPDVDCFVAYLSNTDQYLGPFCKQTSP